MLENQALSQAIALDQRCDQIIACDEPVLRAIQQCQKELQQRQQFQKLVKQAEEQVEQRLFKIAVAAYRQAEQLYPTDAVKAAIATCTVQIKHEETASMYEEAKALLSDPTECQLRLGLVAIKTEDWAAAISHLNGVAGEQATYLRGFAYAKCGNLQQAHREWQSLTYIAIESQKEILKSLAKRQRLLAIQNIEQLVKDENFKKAKVASTEFLNIFGFEPSVQGNLDEHIQPRLETALWHSDWEFIGDTVERVWIEQPNLTSLHNWAVANYYRALDSSVATYSFASLQDMIIALLTIWSLLNFGMTY